MLRAPSNLALSTAREGAATASLGNLGQGLTTLMGKNFFLLSHLNLPSVSLELFALVLSLQPLVQSPSPSSELTRLYVPLKPLRCQPPKPKPPTYRV